MSVSGPWTFEASRSETRVIENSAVRQMTVFEVLDYDSRTNLLIDGIRCHVVAIIYKKVKIIHNQERTFEVEQNNPNATFYKDGRLESEPIWYMDLESAKDTFTSTGSREVEYILAIFKNGDRIYEKSLGSVVTSINASVLISGRYREVVNGGPDEYNPSYADERQKEYSVTGDRIYGAFINCGKGVVTYTYDLERIKGIFAREDDSPANAEDHNPYWTKYARVVGAINYQGKADEKRFSYNNDTIMPDKVMAVNYEVGD